MKALRPALITILLNSLAAGAGAPVQIWTSGDIKRVSTELTPAAAAKGLEGKTLGAYGNGSAAIWRRVKSGEAELHRIKTDVIVVEEGEATLVFGGTMPGARTSAPNELRAASIMGGESRKIGPGDVIRIPAGTPHQFILASGQSVAYFALKIAR